MPAAPAFRKTAARTKTELGKFSGKYVLTELLVCGECGSRLDHGKRICKKSPTLDESKIHSAVVSAMNELFNAQAAKQTLANCITAVLAGEIDEPTLPAVDAQIQQVSAAKSQLMAK